jgi:hypothetical protein
MKFDPVRPLSGKEPAITSHLEKTQPTKLEPVKPAQRADIGTAAREGRVRQKLNRRSKNQPRIRIGRKSNRPKAEPEKPVALKEKEKTRPEKSQTCKSRAGQTQSRRRVRLGSPPGGENQIGQNRARETSRRERDCCETCSEKVQSAKVEPDKLPGTKEPEAKNRGRKNSIG